MFDYANPYLTPRLPVFARNVVATSHPLAAQAGLRMLAAGGNAVDAAVAAAAAMTVLEPCSNGLGSDAFCILWDGTRLHGLNASGRAPAAWTPDYFKARYGADATTPPRRGWDSVTVPGAVSAWVALSQRFGRLPLSRVLAPAVNIAERGYAVPVVVQQKWQAAAALPELTSQPGFAATFLPQGRAPNVGERFAMPGAARALRAIADTGGQALYGGEIAQALAAAAREGGGALTVQDLAAYAPQWVEPVGQDYRGHRLHQIPPNGQGLAALMALGMLQRFDLRALGADSAEGHHLQIEAMKLAFADVYRFVAEADCMECTAEHLLDPAYLAERSRLIDPARAQDFGAGHPMRGGTIYLTAADEQGMMVSFIQSNYLGFGSGVVLPQWGLSLQNRGHAFSLDEASPNAVAPGKRPFHTIIPGFLTRDGQPVMSFGVMGANMQPQGQLQTLVRMLDHGQNPQTACDAPRWRIFSGLSLNIESSMPMGTVQGLVARGHRIELIEDSYQDFGAGQFIWRLGDPSVDGYVAASDTRRDGAAVGY
ncbi:gamma-glutamyltransferase family protein [Azohydromonas lata]|uniref:Gamma-glutamyltransferase family protein n=1 Tax=Azohydromonas lata TaxID=45677 RepID=A0ABU5IHA8_9BURK|nr:gamma-glutamyltransferase family protein [Azohydromonas lata]MDZ5457323.1 gamma-glutamyltransferase family protein [Azohydromonas lata]